MTAEQLLETIRKAGTKKTRYEPTRCERINDNLFKTYYDNELPSQSTIQRHFDKLGLHLRYMGVQFIGGVRESYIVVRVGDE